MINKFVLYLQKKTTIMELELNGYYFDPKSKRIIKVIHLSETKLRFVEVYDTENNSFVRNRGFGFDWYTHGTVKSYGEENFKIISPLYYPEFYKIVHSIKQKEQREEIELKNKEKKRKILNFVDDSIWFRVIFAVLVGIVQTVHLWNCVAYRDIDYMEKNGEKYLNNMDMEVVNYDGYTGLAIWGGDCWYTVKDDDGYLYTARLHEWRGEIMLGSLKCLNAVSNK